MGLWRDRADMPWFGEIDLFFNLPDHLMTAVHSPMLRLLAVSVFSLLGTAVAQAQTLGGASFGIDEIKVGALYHDMPALWSGFSRERRAVDVNAELLFRPLAYTFGGRLRPTLGGTVNVNGETSKAYADLRWEIEAPSGVFFGLGMGAAIHNGELDLIDNGRKALGARVLFHPSAELGYRFDGANSVSLFADHVSNGYSRRYNEAIDTLGLRFGHKFGAASTGSVADAATGINGADFSGLYLGLAGGFQFATADWSAGTTFKNNDFHGAGFAGYNWQAGQGVFGLEVDGAPLRHTMGTMCGRGIACDIAVQGLFSVRSRFGWVIDKSLLYATGGFAFASWDNIASSAATGRQLLSERAFNHGAAVGVGIEHKFTQNIGARAEVLHYGLYGKDLSIPGIGVTTTQIESTVGRMGLSWTFH
jgi:lipid A 3-O-deacylase